MKKKPTFDEFAAVFATKMPNQKLDVSALQNRFVGKRIIEIEHCLIEVLGAIKEQFAHYLDYRRETFKDMNGATNRDEFIFSHEEFQTTIASMRELVVADGTLSLFMNEFGHKLSGFEDKQIEVKKEPTVSHARMLAYMVCSEIDRVLWHTLTANVEVDQMFRNWMNAK